MEQLNNGITTSVRPTSLEEVVGLDHIKDPLRYEIEGSLKLNQPMPSFIISGPGGTGKSTIADIIASLSKGDVEKLLGADLKTPNDLYNLAQRLKDQDVVVIEEAHTLSPKCQAVLLEWIENFKILGGGEYGILLAPKVSFVFPTTDEGQMSKPFRNRCRILNTAYYQITQIEDILIRAGVKIGIDLSTDTKALRLLAQCSRATPRIAVMHRLDVLRKVMIVDNRPYNLDTVIYMLKMHKIHPWGLEHNDIKYCNILYQKLQDNAGKPVAKKILAQSTGFSDNVIDNVIEAYLQQIHAIRVEARGRVLTSFGLEILGLEPIKPDILDLRPGIDLEQLSQLIEDENVRKHGIKGIAPKLGLIYGRDNSIIQDALRQLGFISKKNVGVVKLSDMDLI